jgi:hypothetical protein
MIPSKSTLAGNGEKVSKDSSNEDAAVCEHEKAPTDDEEFELDWTKEALTFKWYEKPEHWDRLCSGEDNADMEDMKTRYKELYLSFLRLDKLKKKTTTKNNDRISSDQKKEIQDEARRVGLLLKEYDSLWTEQGWSSGRKSSGLSRKTPPTKEAQTASTSTSLTSDPVKNPRPTKTKSRKTQTDVGNSDDIPSSPLTNAHCGQKSHDPNMWLQMLQGPKKEGRHLTMRNRSTMTSRDMEVIE